MECLGRNLDDHCCHLGDFGVCRYLEENSEQGYRWSCGLRRELGDWDAVLADPRYQRDVQPFFDWYKSEFKIRTSCKEYPKRIGCNLCGASK